MGICEELTALAGRYSDEVAGFELEESRSSCQEVTASTRGLDGTAHALTQRFVRTAGPRVGYAASEDADEPLEALVGEAVLRAQAVEPTEPGGVLLAPEAKEGAGAAAALDGAPEPPACCDASELAGVARAGLEALLALEPDVCEASCTARVLGESRLVANSLGLARTATHSHCMLRLQYIAEGSREKHDVCVRAFAPTPGEVDLNELATRAVHVAHASLDGGTLASGRYPVVLSREFTCRMLVGMWQALSAQKVATGQSLLAGKLGEKVFSPELTVLAGYEPGFAPGAPGCLGIDSQGARRRAVTCIDGGVFCAPLATLEGASALGLGADAAGFAGRRDTLGRIVPNELVCAPGNLCIVPGQSSLDELLAQMGDGVYLTDIGDIYHSFNLASGGVSSPCRGVMVRGGKLAEPLSIVSVSSSLQQILGGIVAVGSELSWSDLEDLDAYWCGGPDLLVQGVDLTGGIVA